VNSWTFSTCAPESVDRFESIFGGDDDTSGIGAKRRVSRLSIGV
jgi:hypothetical protein